MNWDNYKKALISVLEAFEFSPEIPEVLRNSFTQGKKIFVGGNGGSAAIATHYVCDFSKGQGKNWQLANPRYHAVCMSSNLSYITAISNDNHYNEIFRQQLINLSNEGDIVILISSSGNSPNVIRAAEYAKEKGLIVIGVTGFDGGRLKGLSDYWAHAETNNYELTEDIHSIFGHFLSLYMNKGNLK